MAADLDMASRSVVVKMDQRNKSVYILYALNTISLHNTLNSRVHRLSAIGINLKFERVNASTRQNRCINRTLNIRA